MQLAWLVHALHSVSELDEDGGCVYQAHVLMLSGTERFALVGKQLKLGGSRGNEILLCHSVRGGLLRGADT